MKTDLRLSIFLTIITLASVFTSGAMVPTQAIDAGPRFDTDLQAKNAMSELLTQYAATHYEIDADFKVMAPGINVDQEGNIITKEGRKINIESLKEIIGEPIGDQKAQVKIFEDRFELTIPRQIGEQVQKTTLKFANIDKVKVEEDAIHLDDLLFRFFGDNSVKKDEEGYQLQGKGELTNEDEQVEYDGNVEVQDKGGYVVKGREKGSSVKVNDQGVTVKSGAVAVHTDEEEFDKEKKNKVLISEEKDKPMIKAKMVKDGKIEVKRKQEVLTKEGPKETEATTKIEFNSNKEILGKIQKSVDAEHYIRPDGKYNDPELVKGVQKLFGLPETGTYDELTQRELYKFQTKTNSGADYIIGPRTISALKSKYTDKTTVKIPTTPPLTMDSAFSGLQEFINPNQDTRRTVRQYKNNNPRHVEAIQKILGIEEKNDAGKYIYGSKTKAKVEEFQESVWGKGHHEVDGVVGPNTLAKMREKYDNKFSTAIKAGDLTVTDSKVSSPTSVAPIKQTASRTPVTRSGLESNFPIEDVYNSMDACKEGVGRCHPTVRAGMKALGLVSPHNPTVIREYMKKHNGEADGIVIDPSHPERGAWRFKPVEEAKPGDIVYLSIASDKKVPNFKGEYVNAYMYKEGEKLYLPRHIGIVTGNDETGVRWIHLGLTKKGVEKDVSANRISQKLITYSNVREIKEQYLTGLGQTRLRIGNTQREWPSYINEKVLNRGVQPTSRNYKEIVDEESSYYKFYAVEHVSTNYAD